MLILADHYRCDFKFFISNEQVAPFEQTETLYRAHGNDFTEATVTSRGYTLHIAAAGGAVSVTDSDCPTRDCVHTGAISRAGQSIVCLPAQVVVYLEGTPAAGQPDVIVG